MTETQDRISSAPEHDTEEFLVKRNEALLTARSTWKLVLDHIQQTSNSWCMPDEHRSDFNNYWFDKYLESSLPIADAVDSKELTRAWLCSLQDAIDSRVAFDTYVKNLHS